MRNCIEDWGTTVAMLSSERKSCVETVKDWPKGTRRRGLGYLHDQIWFPADVPVEAPSDHVMCRDFKWYQLYLDRKMIWTPFGTLRLHTFYMGDDDAAVHDHPWWFITFPFRSYTETYEEEIPSWKWYDWRKKIPGDHPMYWVRRVRLVRAWRFHFRRATHRHFVHAPDRPFRTIILTGPLKRNWGFWPDGDTFIPHREWTNYNASDKTMAPEEEA